MPQRKKAKTKKQMKKSINSLWNSLQEEKAKHAKASDMIGRMKLRLMDVNSTTSLMNIRILELQDELETMQNREVHTSEVAASIISNLT